MSIPKHVRTNFNTLLEAAKEGHLALVECVDAKTNETRHVLCAVHENAEGEFDFTPFGHMCPDDNPFDAYIPPETAP